MDHHLPDRRNPRRARSNWRVGAGLATVALGLGVASAGAQTIGTLSGYDSRRESEIPADQLGVILHTLPPDVRKLLVFTQCFGGDVATDPAIANLPNVAIASATSPGETGSTGGYHDDAARALRPGAGRTGDTVHQAGVSGKYQHETPLARGDLAAFSLDSTGPTGPIIARAIVIYFGRETGTQEWVRTLPDSTTVPAPDDVAPPNVPPEFQARRFSNDDDRAAIAAAFASQHQTTVISVGRAPGQGGGHYAQPATLAGLITAVESARTFLEQFANSDGERQFILFVGDHGEQRARRATDHRCRPGTCRVAENEPGLQHTQELRRALKRTPDNAPGFTLFASFDGQNVGLRRVGDGFAPVFAPGSLALDVDSPGLSRTMRLSIVVERVLDISGDGILGNSPGEGISLLFPVAEDDFINRLLGRTYDLTLINSGASELRITDVAMVTGALEPGHAGDRTMGANERVIWSAIALAAVVVGTLAFLALRRRP